MRIVCISDTHGRHDEITVPAGDMLIHAGDVSMMGREHEIRAFNDWLGGLPHAVKIVIAGNHDWMFERDPLRARELVTNAMYLEDSETTAAGLRIWGSPWQPWFYDWAFNLARGPDIAARWALIPAGIDVLVTHGPPAGIMDAVDERHVGCADLERELARVKPRLHVYGHIHEGHGRCDRDDRIYVNASVCDRMYRAVNTPIVLDL